MTPVDIAPHLVEAFSIFKAEFSANYGFLVTALAELETAMTSGDAAIAEWLQAKSKPLENRFHILKGSAGFLGLPEVRDLSQLGEKMFKPGSPFLADPGKMKAEFSRIVLGLGQAEKDFLS